MPEKSEDGRARCSQPELVYSFLSYIVGDVESGEQKRIEEHLTRCAVCRKDMKFFSELHRVGEELFGDE